MHAVSDDAPVLHDVMPWSVRPLRIGRGWPMAPDANTLRDRWALFTAARGEAERDALLHPTRTRGLHTRVGQLPGHRTPTTALAREDGRCPEPVLIQHGAHDRQWLIPDHRLIDAARPELWRVLDDQQIFAVEQAYLPEAHEPAVAFSALLPDGRSPAGRPGRIRPLFRQPGGRDPNLAPGLLGLLSARLAAEVTARDVLAWVAAAARPAPGGCEVPFPADPGDWRSGVALGGRLLWLHTRGARLADPAEGRDPAAPRLPGGSRPYVRAPLPAAPGQEELEYDREQRELRIGAGRISPVAPAAWDRRVGGVRVLEAWWERRTAPGAPGSLEALRPPRWTRHCTSDLLEVISVLTLLAESDGARDALARSLADRPGRTITARALRDAGVLPVPAARRRPASVLDHREEGPDGQFALV
ncbi:type ISP restriction/modification enzyme [Streptomyces sp. NBC_01198]|uniref:type ISP restriction/modification enzyme n=1 Tax=Streptomyces sp. NBC_01198 TaxID=2903769 RepID=UPI002E14429C|nr:DNA methyltransferase [Streptomyces sp. NBC_01198]